MTKEAVIDMISRESNDNSNKLEEVKKYIVTDIEYDTDGVNNVDLPTEMEVDIPNDIDVDDIEEYISEYISDETGFCHDGFCAKPVLKVSVRN